MKKIPVMLVDDEKLVLEDLQTLVDWNELGFEIVATAFNGKQAWLKFNEYRPRVVFTDIRMPFMNGLELIKKLREVDGEVSIFMLTAYEDFSYAREAIKYGVKDYVIKSTLDETVFSDILKKLYTSIEAQDELDRIVKRKAIAEFFETSAMDEQTILQTVSGKSYCYLLVEQDYPIELSEDMLPAFYKCSGKEIEELIWSEPLETGEVIVSRIPGDRILVVLDLPEVSQHQLSCQVFAYGQRINRKLKFVFGRSFTVYTVDRKLKISELKKLQESSKQLFYRKYFDACGKTRCLFEGYDFASVGSPKEESEIVNMQKLQGALEQREMTSVVMYLRDIFAELKSTGDYKLLRRTTRMLYGILKSDYQKLPKHLHEKELGIKENIENWMDCQHLQEWFVECFTQLIREKEKLYSCEYSKVVMQVMDYISRNYGKNDLTIKEIAESVQLSSGHLCSLFKKETGRTLNHYITETRIKEAKRLLSKGNVKVYEVAIAVGYQSSQYFSQIFFKVTGTYPTNYQKETGRMT